MIIRDLTDAEELVMKAVWDLQKEPILSEIVEKVNNDYREVDWRPQTVSTFLSKLVQKKYLKMKRNGKVYTYKVLINEIAYKQKLYKHHIDFWNNGNVIDFYVEMINNGDLTKNDIQNLKSHCK